MAREQRVSAFIDSAIGELDQLRVTLDTKQQGLADLIASRYADVRRLFADNPDQSRLAELRTNAKNRLDEAARQRSKYMLMWGELGKLLDERREIVKQLVSATNEVTGIRETENGAIEAKLNQFTGDELKVSIRTLPGADRSKFKKMLDDFLRTPGTRVLAGTAEAISVMCTPVEFADLLMDGRLTELTKRSRSDAPGAPQLADAFVSKFQLARQWSELDPGADVPVLKEGGKTLQDMLTLQEIPWDDAVSILLNERPVDKLSPGQRSSAMLPLIALAENTPLVIDQPEDNLDNRLVGNVLVNILAELKAQRQIIVCTHNPNIVVSGDAEQVVVLEAEGDRRGRKICSGSIDNDAVVSNVIALMEGGKEAFLARKRRYRL
jgi:ABC-type dipeptide/oligopeptide/nickel transport system ATPase component